MVLYARHWSVIIVVPGKIFASIVGISVFLDLFGTETIKQCPVSWQSPPNTHCVAKYDQLHISNERTYFHLFLLGPPRTMGFAISFLAQIARIYLFSFIVVFSPIFSSMLQKFILVISLDQQYIKSIICLYVVRVSSSHVPLPRGKSSWHRRCFISNDHVHLLETASFGGFCIITHILAKFHDSVKKLWNFFIF